MKNKENGLKTGFNKLRANIQVNNDTPYRGFGFLSAGENEEIVGAVSSAVTKLRVVLSLIPS